MSGEFKADVLIAGGGCGGVGAALAVLRAGLSCVLIEPTSMLGGQLSSQGVPPDEHAWIEGAGPGADASFRGCTGTYTAFRERVRAWYRERGALSEAARRDARLNPGGGWVSRLCFEPRLADGIVRSMLAEADGGRGLLTVVHGGVASGADVDGDRVRAVAFDVAGRRVEAAARFVLDATETGEVLDVCRVEHAIGAEAASVYGEAHGRADLASGVLIDATDQQACTWCFAVEHDPHGDHTTDAPAGYARWRAFTPDVDGGWTGRLFDWTVPSHNRAGRVVLALVPPPDEPAGGAWELWRYRRVVDGGKHADGRLDVSLFNVVQMDFWGAPLLGVSGAARAGAERAAREQSACFLHWMRTEAPRHDGGAGYPGLRLRGDVLGSADGFAIAPYIREPRRLLARAMLTEAHVGTDQRARAGLPHQGLSPHGCGALFADSVAVGHYAIDLHPSCSGRNSVYVAACPYRVPLGSLVPRRVRNVIAAGKCLGVSHVANGCTRLHPAEWGVGEAAGVLASWCVREGTEPHAVCEDPRAVAGLRSLLESLGCPTAWPWEAGLSEDGL